MVIEQNYYIDLVPNGQLNVVHVSQYDYQSRVIRFSLTKDGKAYQLPVQGVTASVKGLKPDGTVFLVNADVELTNVKDKYSGQVLFTKTDIKFPLALQMTTVAGEVKCKLNIASGGNELIGTASFTMLVDPTPFSDRPISESDIPYFEDFVQRAANAASAAAAAAQRAEDAASTISPIPVAAITAMWDGLYNENEDYSSEAETEQSNIGTGG